MKVDYSKCHVCKNAGSHPNPSYSDCCQYGIIGDSSCNEGSKWEEKEN